MEKVFASTFTETDNFENAVLSFVESPADSQVIQGRQFFKIFDENQLEYILLANGGSDDVYMIGKIAVFQIQNLLVAYKERFDKDNFIKNLLLDNLLRLIFTIVLKNYILTQKSDVLSLLLRLPVKKTAVHLRMCVRFSEGSQKILSQR